MSVSLIPQAVLSQSLMEAINGRRVRTAVFTTFNFDPGFFEINILPLLFDQSFHPNNDKYRIVQLEDALRKVDHLDVYYDRSALSQDAEPARLPYRRIDVRRANGCFHPKLIFLLVDEYEENQEAEDVEPYQSLIVGVLSANITRSGWWESVECAHFEEIYDQDVDPGRIAYRKDLLGLIQRIKRTAFENQTHPGLDVIHEFLSKRVSKQSFSNVSAGKKYYTQLFFGQGSMNFSQWLESLHLRKYGFNLEVISPYFDAQGARPLEDMIDAVEPREVRVYLPEDYDGTASVAKSAYNAIAQWGSWSSFAEPITHRGRTETAEAQLPRRVHAKVYRLWRSGGPELLIIGSVNLTSSAHSHSAAGNLEAAFLVDVTDTRRGRWWLSPLDYEVENFIEHAPSEEEGLDTVYCDLSLQFDWASNSLHYLIEGKAPKSLTICTLTGESLFEISKPRSGKWVACLQQEAQALQDYIQTSSVVIIQHPKGSWHVLVREENMGYRPSLMTQLSHDEILEYWSLLTPEQRAAFIEARLFAGEEFEGLPVGRDTLGSLHDSIFDHYSGIYHAFGCLKRHVQSALEEDRISEAETRLFGAKYDSLPSLLKKVDEESDVDPIIRYVMFLSAQQLVQVLKKNYPGFMKETKKRAQALEAELEKVSSIRRDLPIQDMEDGTEFLQWFERAFLDEVVQ